MREPFFHASQGLADTAQVQVINDGHFAVAFVEEDGKSVHWTLPFIVDPSVVFDTDTTLTNPSGFFGPNAPDAIGIAQLPQQTTSRTPCAFAAAKIVIPPGASINIATVYGHAATLDTFLSQHSPKIRTVGFIHQKRALIANLVDDITKHVSTATSSPIFNAYVKQDYLDNTLRGGLPLVLGDPSKPKIFHVFSRIHGDIERDYNYFQLDPTVFSQGPGNFRDVNQNRRMDVSLNPVVGDFNVRTFLSLVQSDGFNPLTVAATNFRVPPEQMGALLAVLALNEPSASRMRALLSSPFRPGQLVADMRAQGIPFNLDRMQAINKILAAATQEVTGQYAPGQGGFWADVRNQWTGCFVSSFPLFPPPPGFRSCCLGGGREAGVCLF